MTDQNSTAPIHEAITSGGLDGLDRWVLLPVGVGLVFAWVQTVHVFQMMYYGTVGVVLEAALPLALAVVLGTTGPWLRLKGYRRNERRRIVAWMALVAALVGLLFGWALSHQMIVGYPFPHERPVATTNLIAGSLLGLVVGMYDVASRRHRLTVEKERETVALQRARLSVLNRVLRHNIRNDASVVRGYTENIADRASGETAELAEQAAAKTGDLVALGEKAREIERTIEVDEDSIGEVELRPTVDAVVDSYGRDDVAFTVDVPDELRLSTSEPVVFRVLDELVENSVEHGSTRSRVTGDSEARSASGSRHTTDDAVDHGARAGQDADAPGGGTATARRVDISAEAVGEEWIDIVVADDGPGIPRHERESLRAGVETALDHGSGLGLWLANWGVASLGGELSFADSEWGGTAVRVRLPRGHPRSGCPAVVGQIHDSPDGSPQ